MVLTAGDWGPGTKIPHDMQSKKKERKKANKHWSKVYCLNKRIIINIKKQKNCLKNRLKIGKKWNLWLIHVDV